MAYKTRQILQTFLMLTFQLICLSVCVSDHFWGTVSASFFPPFPKSDVKNVRDLKSLGKSNGKKWSQIWKLFQIKGLKSLHKKKCFGANFALMSRIFFLLVFLTPFNGIFAPTSWSQMSQLFRCLEFLGKSNGKKWSQISNKGCKITVAKTFFYVFFHLFSPFKRLFAPTSQSLISKLFRFWNPWQKVMERSCVRV